jgi:type I restriction enzyme, S subunit
VSTWPQVQLGEFCEVFSGYAFKSAQFTDAPDDIPLVKGENVGQGEILWGISKRWPKADTDGLSRFWLEPDDVVLALDRPWVPAGLKFARIRAADPPALLVQRVARLRATPGLEQPFLYYIIGSPDFTAYVKNAERGVGVPHISGNQVREYRFRLPPPRAQRRIAEVLSAYDNLIENNRRRLRLLEDAVQKLYREWFVRLRFPGCEHTVIVNGVPEGWARVPLSDLANITMGQSPESQYYNRDGEGLPFHQGVANFGDRFVENHVYCTARGRIAQAGDILCSVRAPVGRLNVTLDRIVIGRGLAALRSKRNHHSLLYYALKAHFFKEDLIGGGAIFASVTKKEFGSQEILTAPDRLSAAFEDVSHPVDEQLRVLTLQIQRLRVARNLLLPRLLNGDIQV